MQIYDSVNEKFIDESEKDPSAPFGRYKYVARDELLDKAVQYFMAALKEKSQKCENNENESIENEYIVTISDCETYLIRADCKKTAIDEAIKKFSERHDYDRNFNVFEK